MSSTLCARTTVALGSFPASGRSRSSRLLVRCSNNGSAHSSLKLDTTQEFHSPPFQRVRRFLHDQLVEFQKIEWPTFENTVKTSVFVIVLSFLLIVALTAVDSGYSFVLSKLMK